MRRAYALAPKTVTRTQNPSSSTAGASPARPTGARLTGALLAYSVGVVLLITLAPFRFRVPGELRVLVGGEWFDVLNNLVLFVPLGFLYPLTRPSGRLPPAIRAALFGALLSASIETAQLLAPLRYASLPDLLANSAGAWLGAWLQRAASARIRVSGRLVGRLSLELPLIGLLYLLVPLLWLQSAVPPRDEAALLPLLPLGLFGAWLLAALQRHHFGPAGVLSPRGVAGVAAGWLLLGVFPLLPYHPLLLGGGIAAAAAAAWLEARRSRGRGAGERRFEEPALRRAAPWLAGYFLALVLVPLAGGAGPWTGWIGFPASATAIGTAEQIAMVEAVAALTVLGYLLEEARGRREISYGRTAPRLALECGAVAAVLEAARGLQPATGASLAQLLLLLAAGLLGGWIYHLQRDHVRSLLAAPVAD